MPKVIKLYRVECLTDDGNSAGYIYGVYKGTVRALWEQSNENLGRNTPDHENTFEPRRIEITVSSHGLADAFNRYGAHPDNG